MQACGTSNWEDSYNFGSSGVFKSISFLLCNNPKSASDSDQLVKLASMSATSEHTRALYRSINRATAKSGMKTLVIDAIQHMGRFCSVL